MPCGVQYQNLGTAITATSTYNGIAEGNVFYGITRDGNIGRLYRYNGATVDLTVDLPGSLGAWAIEKDGNKVYVGTYSDAYLYEYDLTTNTLVQVADFGAETYTWDMIRDGRMLYAVTYPNAKLFGCNLDTGVVTDHGSMSSKQYARTVETYNGKVYVGVGAPAELIEFDPATGTKTNILPASHAGDSFAYDLKRIGDQLFIGMDSSHDVLRYDLTTQTMTVALPDSLDPAVPGSAPSAGGVQFVGLRGHLYDWNAATKQLTRLGKGDPNYWLSGARVVGNRIVGVNTAAHYVEMDFAGNVLVETPLSAVGLPSTEVEPFSLSAYNGKVNVGYNTLRTYNTGTGAASSSQSNGEVKAQTVIDGVTYYASYPAAEIYAAVNGNHQKIHTIGNQQSRPNDMESYGKGYVVGTSALYGMRGGAITYGTVGGSVTTIRDFVPNQSVSAVAIDADGFYAGTSTAGEGLSTPPGSGHVVGFSRATNQKIFDVIPESGSVAINDLEALDNSLYALTATGRFYRLSRLDGSTLVSTKRPYRQIMTTRMGKLYALSGNTFYELDPQTLDVIDSCTQYTNLLKMAVDEVTGDVYFTDGTQLQRFDPDAQEDGVTMACTIACVDATGCVSTLPTGTPGQVLSVAADGTVAWAAGADCETIQDCVGQALGNGLSYDDAGNLINFDANLLPLDSAPLTSSDALLASTAANPEGARVAIPQLTELLLCNLADTPAGTPIQSLIAKRDDGTGCAIEDFTPQKEVINPNATVPIGFTVDASPQPMLAAANSRLQLAETNDIIPHVDAGGAMYWYTRTLSARWETVDSGFVPLATFVTLQVDPAKVQFGNAYLTAQEYRAPVTGYYLAGGNVLEGYAATVPPEQGWELFLAINGANNAPLGNWRNDSNTVYNRTDAPSYWAGNSMAIFLSAGDLVSFRVYANFAARFYRGNFWVTYLGRFD